MHWSDPKYTNDQQMHFNISNVFIQKILTSIFISVINQLDAQDLFYNEFIPCLYMFPCAPDGHL